MQMAAARGHLHHAMTQLMILNTCVREGVDVDDRFKQATNED